MLKAKNIEWDIDMDEVYEKLDNMSVEEAAEALKIPVKKYKNMDNDKRHDYVEDFFRHCPGAMLDFLSLPDSVVVPDEIALDPEYKDNADALDEDIANWLSDEYGYCHEGFELEWI